MSQRLRHFGSPPLVGSPSVCQARENNGLQGLSRIRTDVWCLFLQNPTCTNSATQKDHGVRRKTGIHNIKMYSYICRRQNIKKEHSYYSYLMSINSINFAIIICRAAEDNVDWQRETFKLCRNSASSHLYGFGKSLYVFSVIWSPLKAKKKKKRSGLSTVRVPATFQKKRISIGIG